MIRTGQYYNRRDFWIESASQEAPRLLVDLLHHFVAAAEQQTGLTFPVELETGHEGHAQVSVHMDTWPMGESFGDWFDALMAEYHVAVDD